MQAETVIIDVGKKTKMVRPFQDYAILGLALLLDFTDAIPSELLSAVGLFAVPVAYEAAVSAAQAMFLSYLGVPIAPVLAMTGSDLIPFIDFIPWSTIAVLDKRFNIKIPYVTRLMNG